MIGRTVGAYRVLAKIGEGGMGTVFVGEHTLLGRRAAIKVLRPEMSLNESVVNRFFNEARLVTSISDPGIVQVFDFGVHEGSAYIVMELLEGETLQRRLKRLGRLPASEVMRLGRQLATSLAAAHGKNVVHRDLKPDNIFIIGDPAVTGGERAKILDFGIAKLLQSDDSPDSNHTQTGMLMGTPIYMSPEQCRGAGEVDHRSDLYALGCVMFRMLAGRPPFEGRGSGEVIASHLKEPAPLVATFAPDVPPEVEDIVQRCLAKDPASRPQTALELAALMGSVEQGAVYRPTPMPIHTPVVSAHEAYTVQITPAQQAALNEVSTPTTMQGVSGQSAPVRPAAPKKRSVAIIAGVAACVIAGGIVAIVSLQGPTKAETTASEITPAAAPAAPPAPAETPAPAPAPAPATVETPPAPATAETPPAPATAEPPPAPATVETAVPGSAESPSREPVATKPAATKPATTKPTTKPVVTKPKPATAKPKPAVTKPKPTTESKPTAGSIDRGD